MNQKLFCLLGVIVLVVSAPVFAQDGELEELQIDATIPYEIRITPTITRMHLRSLIFQVEDDFFDKFNELNIDDEYDVICYKFVPTSSHIPKRVCEPAFYIMARGENAAEYMAAFGSCSTCVNAAPLLLSRRGLRNNTAEHFEILQEKMEALNESDNDLKNIGSALARLKSRLKNFGK